MNANSKVPVAVSDPGIRPGDLGVGSAGSGHSCGVTTL